MFPSMRPVDAVEFCGCICMRRMTRWRPQEVQKPLTSYAPLLSFDGGFYATYKSLDSEAQFDGSVTVHSVKDAISGTGASSAQALRPRTEMLWLEFAFAGTASSSINDVQGVPAPSQALKHLGNTKSACLQNFSLLSPNLVHHAF